VKSANHLSADKVRIDLLSGSGSIRHRQFQQRFQVGVALDHYGDEAYKILFLALLQKGLQIFHFKKILGFVQPGNKQSRGMLAPPATSCQVIFPDISYMLNASTKTAW
jgi:hypothetical protein